MTTKKIIHFSYFAFVALLAASIPVSRFTMSVFQFCLAGIFILEGVDYRKFMQFYSEKKTFYWALRFLPFHLWLIADGIARQINRISQKRTLLIFLLFFLVYLIGLIYTSNIGDALKVLRNKLPVLLLPVFFTAITSINRNHKHLVLLFFVLSVIVSSFISFSIFLGGEYDDIRRISPFINHIHFSIFICYAVFILYWFIRTQVLKGVQRWLAMSFLVWLAFFLLVILKSLTGVVILLLGSYLVLFFNDIFRVRINPYLRYATLVILPGIIIAILLASVLRFYDVEEVDPATLERYTAQGNLYNHDIHNKMIENGYFVHLYISEKELREEWNKVSNFDYDSLDRRGQNLKYTLIRYLTSKGFRKDAVGVKQLSPADIHNVEAGLANYIYANRFSLYPRIYQVLWEFDIYSKTKNPTGHSVTQRVESLRMGLMAAQQNPLFGIGTGDLVAIYHQQYEEAASPVPANKRITGANQFLNFVVRFGIIGLLVILFAWIYPALKVGAFRNPLFIIFLFIVTLTMFSEEMLRFQSGITFFAFFYSFFVLLEESSSDDEINLLIKKIL